MELEILHADAHQERLDFFVIWTMPVLPILVMLMQFVKQVQLMDLSHARVHKVIKDRIVLKTSTNVSKVSLINKDFDKNNLSM